MNQPNNQQNSSSLILPPGHAAGGKIITRRNFLKLAGATAVALPFLKPQEAFATGCPITQSTFLRGTQAANTHYYGKPNYIPENASRAYYKRASFPSSWTRNWRHPSCMTVYPDWETFHNGGANNGYDDEIYLLFRSSMPGDMISCYQEAATLTYASNGYLLRRQQGLKIPKGPLKMGMKKTIEKHLFEIAHGMKPINTKSYGTIPATVYQVRVGAIDVNFMNRGNTNVQGKIPTRHGVVKEWMYEPLDWFGLDSYQGSLKEDFVGQALEDYKDHADRVQSKFSNQVPGYFRTAVCVTECNSKFDTFNLNGYGPVYVRRDYFKAVANWVATHYTGVYRGFFTFWAGPGTHPDSGAQWAGGQYPASQATIQGLVDIGNRTDC